MPPSTDCSAAKGQAAPQAIEWRTRRCPICGSAPGRTWLEQHVDFDALDRFAFSSRKIPEYMRFKLGLCEACDMVFAESVPSQAWFQDSYREAGFDSAGESHFAAVTYTRELERILPQLPSRTAALDIGAGDGAFLARLVSAGFESVIGVEPSEQPAKQALPSVRHLIRNDFFRPGDFAPASFDLITCFQTLEHLEDPLELCRSAFGLLRPGGMLLVADHNFRSPVARMMGQRSPIYDIEHLQLFSPRSLAGLYRAAGFSAIDVRPLRNAYPLTYWLKLMPLPSTVKNPLLKRLSAGRAGSMVIPARVGNLVASGIRKT